ncbi:glycoside hydrolase family 25 protein [Niallia circulans]
MGKIADISKWQGTINWSKAKNELDYVFIRVQYGSNLIDSKYKEYVAGAKQYKIPFGHYAYAQYVSVSDAVQEAKDFWKRSDKNATTFVIDVEEITTRNSSDLVPATQAFIDYLHSQGAKKVGLYSGDSFYKTNNLSKVKADFLWIARYGVNNGQPSTKPSVACDLWQYTSTGSVSGITGNVDLNAIYGSKPLSYFTSSSTPSPEPTPEPEIPPIEEPDPPVIPELPEEPDDGGDIENPDDDEDGVIEPPIEIPYDKELVNPNSLISSYIVRNGENVANPQLFLATPTGNVIADLSESYNRKLTLNFTNPNELSFSLPYEIEVLNKLVSNKTVNLLRERFLIKLLFAGVESWYIITQKQPSSSDNDLINVQCFSLEYELRYRKMLNYQAVSYNCLQVLNDVLKDTNWSIGYINDEFNLKYHQFDVSSSSKLDFINEICKNLMLM